MSYTVHGGEGFHGLGCGRDCPCRACKSRQGGYGETYTRDEDDDEPEPSGTNGYGNAGGIGGSSMYGFNAGVSEGYGSPIGYGQAPTKLKLLCRKSIIFSNFIVGDYRLRPPHYEPLQRLAAALAPLGASKNVVVLVEGHTDSSGQDLMNRGLSQSRAHEVVNFLRQSNVKVRIIVIPRGEKLPRASNATAAGRAQNRRVEVRVCRLPPPPPLQA